MKQETEEALSRVKSMSASARNWRPIREIRASVLAADVEDTLTSTEKVPSYRECVAYVGGESGFRLEALVIASRSAMARMIALGDDGPHIAGLRAIMVAAVCQRHIRNSRMLAKKLDRYVRGIASEPFIPRELWPSDSGPYVYIVSACGRVKIGTTDGPPGGRISGIQCPEEPKLLALLSGGRKLESELHERFRGSRVYGEWFMPTPELMAFIGECHAGGYWWLDKLVARTERIAA